jgi:hypothetical protein
MPTLIDTALNGSGKPTEVITTRHFELAPEEHARMMPKALDYNAEQHAEAAAKAKSGPFKDLPKWAQARANEIGQVSPDLGPGSMTSAAARLSSMSRSYEQAARAKEAIGNGLLREYTHEDGTVERGIVSLDGNGQPLREGQWVKMDANGQRQEMSTFRTGKAEGESLTFDPANGRVTEKGFYREGVKAGTFYSNIDENGFARHVDRFEQGELKGSYDRTPEGVKAKRQESQDRRAGMEAVFAIRPKM